jgi:hypothetical protein
MSRTDRILAVACYFIIAALLPAAIIVNAFNQ